MTKIYFTSEDKIFNTEDSTYIGCRYSIDDGMKKKELVYSVRNSEGRLSAFSITILLEMKCVPDNGYIPPLILNIEYGDNIFSFIDKLILSDEGVEIIIIAQKEESEEGEE